LSTTDIVAKKIEQLTTVQTTLMVFCFSIPFEPFYVYLSVLFEYVNR